MTPIISKTAQFDTPIFQKPPNRMRILLGFAFGFNSLGTIWVLKFSLRCLVLVAEETLESSASICLGGRSPSGIIALVKVREYCILNGVL
jgi:hypothetical protein